MTSSMKSMSYAVGIDLGGTRTDILVRRGSVTQSLTTTGGNLRLDDPGRIARRIAGVLDEVLTHDAPVRLCMGAAGADDPRTKEVLARELRNALPRLEAAEVLSDQRIAWEAAFGGTSGILVIAGTGSGCFTVDTHGREFRTGGWGPRVGDPGSGRNLGMAALRHTLTRAESGTYSVLADGVAKHLIPGISLFGPDPVSPADLLGAIYAPDFKVSSLAPVVLEALEEDCPAARDVTMEESQRLASQCKRLLDTFPGEVTRVALMGGLALSAAYVRMLTAVFKQQMPSCHIEVPDTTPVTGALRLVTTRT